MKRLRGFLLIDMLSGIVLFGVIAGVLAVATQRESAASRKLAEARRATNIAEAILSAIQSHVSPAVERGVHFSIAEVSKPDDVVDGKWVSISVQLENGHATLIGLVPASVLLPGNGGAR